MQIFIMRHGQAGMNASSDAARALTEQGVDEVVLMAKWLKNSQLCFDHVFVSPYKRAQQTAKTLLLAANLSDEFTTLDFITPNDNAKTVHDYLDGICANNACQNILIVSHMPLVSYLVAELTAGQAAPIFQTAAIAEVIYSPERMQGVLQEIVAPR